MAKKNLLNTLLSAALLVFTSYSFAEPTFNGFYFSGLGGLGYVPEFKETLGPDDTTYKYRYRNIGKKICFPYQLGLSVGYKNGPFRYEAEGVLNQSKVRRLISTDGAALSTFKNGSTSSYGFLGNVFYDFDSLNSSWHPELGLGLGYLMVRNRIQFTDERGLDKLQKTNSGIAGQAIAGYAFNSSNSLSWALDYSYLRTAKRVNFTGKPYQAHMLDLVVSYFKG